MKVFLKIAIVFSLLLSLACSAQVSGREDALQKVQEKNYEKTIYWMPMANQRIQLVYDEDVNNLMVVSYITIDKSKLNDTKELSFILDEDTKMKTFTINDEARPVERILQYDESNFEERLEYAFVEKIRFFANIWKVTLTEEDLAQDEIKLMIKYVISDQAEDQAYCQDKDGFTLNGELWWYPSTRINGGTIEIEIIIKDDYQVTYSGKQLPSRHVRSYKFYEHLVQNLFDTPLSLEAKKIK